jgi:putative nucleotidyltransferase with HDIG domain
LTGILSAAGAAALSPDPGITLMFALTALVCSALRVSVDGREYETIHTMLLFLCFWYGGPGAGLLTALVLTSGSVLDSRDSLRAGAFHVATVIQALLILPLALLFPRGTGGYPPPVYLALVPLLFLARRLAAPVPRQKPWRSLAFLGFLANVPAVLLAIHVTENFGRGAALVLCGLCVLYLALIRRETLAIEKRAFRLRLITRHNSVTRALLGSGSLTEFITVLEAGTGPGFSFFEKGSEGWTRWTSSGSTGVAALPKSFSGGLSYSSPAVPGLFITAEGSAAEAVSIHDRSEARDFSEQIARTWQVASARIHQEEALFSVALLLARIADLKDRYTKMHSLRVAALSSALGSELGLSDQELAMLRTGALLHDIGKVSLPSEILGKKGILTSRERTVIRDHPGEGATLVSGLSRFRKAAETVLHHHERMDGSGYPSGLRGSGIPLHSRIVAVADTFDAITADRPYHPEVQSGSALREIQAGRGTLYDARVVDALARLVEAGKW